MIEATKIGCGRLAVGAARRAANKHPPPSQPPPIVAVPRRGDWQAMDRPVIAAHNE
jgi:hypothetical protein